MRLLGQLETFLFFYEKISRTQAQRRNQNKARKAQKVQRRNQAKSTKSAKPQPSKSTKASKTQKRK